MREMDNYQRATQIWSVLTFAARTQQIVSYEMLRKLTGMAQVGLGYPLGTIAAYCIANRLPMLTSIAVSKKTGLPSVPLPGQEIHDMHAEQARVFVHGWLDNAVPRVRDFEVARRKVFGTKATAASKLQNLALE